MLQWVGRHQENLWRLSLIVVISFFAAKGTNLWIANKYLPLDFSAFQSGIRSSSPALEPLAEPNLQTIISRNIFDSEARKRLATGNSQPATGSITPSTLPFELMGTIVFKNAKFSVALIKDRGSNKMAYYGTGDSLSSALVRTIERFRVIIENGGRLESLELKAGESKLMSAPKLYSPTSPNPGSSDGVAFEEIGPGRFSLPGSVIEDTMSNFSQILTQARMIPNLTPDNKTDGFKVFQIKPGSIFEKMGLKDQDIIKRVNGTDLDSFEKATGLFTALRNEKSISIDIVRNGARLNYTYEIR